jgi:hypothetical protein
VTVTLSFDRPERGSGHSGRVARGLKAIRDTVSGLAASAIRPHKTSLKRLTEMPLTVAAVPCVDYAAFHLAHGWGWLVTGLSLVIVEHLIADEG